MIFFVKITFDINDSTSISANLLPIQNLVPCPKGMNENLLALLNSGLDLNHLSGMYFVGSGNTFGSFVIEPWHRMITVYDKDRKKNEGEDNTVKKFTIKRNTRPFFILITFLGTR